MYGLAKQLFILLCLFGLVVGNIEPYSSKARQSKSLNEPDVVSTYTRFKDNAPTLLKAFQVLCEILLAFIWILDGILGVFLWILNEVVKASTDLSYKIFGGLFNIVKLLEALGFGIKFILEVNFSLVSYLLDTASTVKNYFQHAFTLVKISLANETNHVYESGSMALEGVQNLFISRIEAIWNKVHELACIIVDNFDGFPKPNIRMIASSLVAATTFFIESIVISAGIFSEGFLFLFNYAGELICEIHTQVLTYLFMVLSMVFTGLLSIMQYMIFLVTMPFYFIANTVSAILQLLNTFWRAFTKHCSWLDETVRSTLYIVLNSLLDLAMTILSGMSNLVSMYVPGGIYGLIVLLVSVSIVYFWRREVSSGINFIWLYCKNLQGDVQDDNVDAGQDSDEELIAEHNEDRENNEHTFDESEPEDPNKLFYKLEREKDKRLCVICQDKVKNILLLPCRHVCLCQRCYQEIRNNRLRLAHCPLCRQHVETYMEVFV